MKHTAFFGLLSLLVLILVTGCSTACYPGSDYLDDRYPFPRSEKTGTGRKQNVTENEKKIEIAEEKTAAAILSRPRHTQKALAASGGVQGVVPRKISREPAAAIVLCLCLLECPSGHLGDNA
ncbi:hypothetical protein [Pontibacter brevis]